MNTDSIAYQYAEALAEIGGKDLLKMETELLAIRDVASSDTALSVYFESPRVNSDVKKEQFKKAFGGKVSDTMLNFLFILVEKRRESQLLPICDAFVELVDIQFNRVRPTVYVSRDFDDADIKKINELVESVILSNKSAFGLNEQIDKFEFIISNEVNPELIGGIALRVGDSYWDASVSRFLKDWKTHIGSKQINEHALMLD